MGKPAAGHETTRKKRRSGQEAVHPSAGPPLRFPSFRLAALLLVAVTASLILTTCGNSEFYMDLQRIVEQYEAEQEGLSTYAVTENGFTGTLAIGDAGTVTVGTESLKMIYANDSTNISFPTEVDDGTPATLTTKFWMAETEVTNAVMAEVLQWAYDNGKFSSPVTDPNGLDTTTAKHGGQELLNLGSTDCRVDYDGSGTFSVEIGYENNPVTNVSWYGAVMFCNWLTAMRDGNTDNVVYVWTDTGDGSGGPPDGIWQDDETDENTTLNGYRLPTSDEWGYTARYLGTTAPSTGDDLDTERLYGNDDGSWTNSYYWTPGDYASGATADINDGPACQAVAVYSGQAPTPTDEAEVKSLGASSANALGLYDMSGNVWEWCFTESGSARINRDAGWDLAAFYLQVGLERISNPDFTYFNLGFRLCRTAD